ncbi:hypothetical protein H0H92_012452 [Tricholoma furcatifolium]|nr:hypothetical protein H0H92_012452 [Tricholoma furcatifolium]
MSPALDYFTTTKSSLPDSDHFADSPPFTPVEDTYHNPRLDPANYLEGPLSSNPATRLRQMLARPGIVAASMVCSIEPTMPVIADADTGFGGPAMVARTVTRYAKAGVAALHIEDQVQTKRCGHLLGKQVVSREEFLIRVRSAVLARDAIPGGSDFVIIARTDSAQVLGMEEAIIRLQLASKAGADVCFIEGVRTKELLESTVAALAPKPVLVNVISGGLTPSFTCSEAESMGAKIIIFSLVSCVAMVHAVRSALYSLKKTGTDFVSANGMDPKAFFQVMGLDDVVEFDALAGGSKIILKYAGKDATQEYDPIHPPDAITTNLPPEKHLGPVAPDTVEKVEITVTEEEKARQARVAARPPLSEILNLHDFEAIARLTMADKAWAYYSSAADDEITNRENHAAYHRPRVLRNVTNVDWSTTILGHKTTLGKLGHPDGELNLTRAAAKHGVIQMIPTLASCSFDEIVDGAQPGQVQFFQLYVNKDRAITKRIVQHAEQRGIKGLFITVDAPQLGRREKDMRMKFEADDPSEVTKAGSGGVDRSQGAARAISDALEAYDRGLAGVVLSNHGGRQLDFARSGIEILVEVVEHLKEKRGLTFPNEKFQLFVDGGVRRATDVLKAIALGATAGTSLNLLNGNTCLTGISVGVGRPFLYAFSSYGPDGVDKALQILHDEFEMNMRLLGARTLKEVVPSMVDASNIHSHIVAVPGDRLYDSNYESLQHATLRTIKNKL